MTGTASTLDKQLDIALSIIAPLLKDPAITDIYIDGADKIYVKHRDGRVEIRQDLCFESPQHLQNLADLLARARHRELTAEHPFLDTVLSRQRLNVVTAPVYPPGTCLTIRKKPQNRFTAEDLLRLGTLTPDCLSLLKQAVGSGRRILVAGETGSGKTTLLNVLCSFIDEQRGRVITIEDTRELFFDHPFLVPLLVSPHTADDRERRFSEVLINALRMDPAWTILGEIRGSEALTLLDAFICHPGMATLHARGSLEALTRLKTILCTRSALHPQLAEDHIFQALDLIAYIHKTPQGPRKLIHLIELSTPNNHSTITPLYPTTPPKRRPK
jgi:pilus assembly protein CpaF